MLIAPRARLRSRGFTAVELVAVLLVMAVVVGVGAPLMGEWIRNNKVRAVANTLQNGLRTAQTEAIRRSQQVVFILTDDKVDQDADVTAAANGKYWAVYTVPIPDSDDSVELVDTGVISDIGAGVTISGPASVCFSSLGRMHANSAPGIEEATCALPTGGATQTYGVAMDGTTREYSVLVGVGGQVRMCDPTKDLATAPDGCPT